jgi:hypothetical protein
MGDYISERYYDFMGKFLTNIPLATALHKLGTYVTDTICTNTKSFPKAFRNWLQTGKRNFSKTQSLQWPWRIERSYAVQFYYCQLTVMQRTLKQLATDIASKDTHDIRICNQTNDHKSVITGGGGGCFNIFSKEWSPIVIFCI